jgi:serine protease
MRTCLISLFALGTPLFAQSDLPRAVPPKASIQLELATHHATRVVVKLADGARRDDAALVAVLGARRARSLFEGLERELTALRARVLEATPPGQRPPADLSLYYEVETRDAADSRALLAALNALPQVELAYPRELPTPPPGDIPPLTPSFVLQQGYRDAAPNGIGAFANQQLAGGWGQGITILDIEWGWWFDHEDLAALRPSSLVGPPVNNNSYNDHGLAVAGELVGDPDAFGVTGLSPDARFLTATNYPATGYSVAAAIVRGMPSLQAGDVMLLEAQASTPLGLGPTEWVQADFDAIQNAVRAGIVVVEAAGNGGVNLDDPRLNGLFDVSVRDSGAIIVGASEGNTLVRASFSCYGARIDANGWGRNVASTGYGGLFSANGDRRQTYTATFNGTSSASPIVTGAAVALRGAARAQWDAARAAALDGAAIRALLRAHGTAMNPNQGIGRRPDLDLLLRAAGLQRGLRLQQRAVIGQSVGIETTPSFAATANDAWVTLGALAPANVPLSAPFVGVDCDRLLLDPASLLALVNGTFATSPAVWSLPIPNSVDLRGVRYYLQGITLQAATGNLCATNSAMLFVEP